MDAFHRTFRPWMSIAGRQGGSRFPVIDLIALSLAAGLLGLAIVVFARRLDGAFESSLGSSVFLASVAAAIVWTVSIRLATVTTGRNRGSLAFRRFLEWSPTIALPLLGVALAVEGTSTFAILVAAILIAGEEYWAARFAQRPTTKPARGKQSRLVFGRAAEVRFNRHASAVEVEPDVMKPVVAIDAEVSGDLWQEQRRFRGEQEETITGVIRCQIAAHDRMAIEHVAFCPSLSAVPILEMEPIDGCDCSVRATHIFRYGARIEVKLEQACSEPTECLVAFEARVALERSESGSRNIGMRHNVSESSPRQSIAR
jgi:hypothetical protein